MLVCRLAIIDFSEAYDISSIQDSVQSGACNILRMLEHIKLACNYNSCFIWLQEEYSPLLDMLESDLRQELHEGVRVKPIKEGYLL